LSLTDLRPQSGQPVAPPDRLTPLRLLLLAMALLSAAALPLAWSWRAWSDWDGPLSYQPLIPIAAAYLFWRRREEVALIRKEIVALYGAGSPLLHGGLGMMAAGCALLCFSYLSRSASAGVAALVVITAGLVNALSGPHVVRALRGPLLFLLTMVPLPDMVLARGTLFFRLWCADVAGNILHSLGLPALVEGSIVRIGGYRMEVEGACSGMAILFPVLSMTLWLLVLNRRRRPGASILLLLVGFVASLAMNVARITAMGLLGEKSPATAQQLHDLNSWVFTLAAVAITFWVAARMNIRISPAASSAPVRDGSGIV